MSQPPVSPPPSGRRTGGRRAAVAPTDPRAGRRLVHLLALVVAGVALVVGAGLAPVPTATPEPGLASRDSARDVVCPTAPRLASTRLALTAPAAGAVDLDGDAASLAAGAVLDRPAGDVPVVVRAEGETAAGLAGLVAGGGQAVACADPRGSWWFSGAGAAPGRESVLVLTNPREGVATVDVSVFGPRGPVQAPDLRGVSVPAGESVSLPLAELAPSAGDVSLAVVSGRGLVAAAVIDRVSPSSRIAEWIPAQSAPGRSTIVPGVPRGSGPVELVLTNPGELATLASVRLSAETGSFAPEDLPDVRVDPGATVRVALPRAAIREQTSVRIEADAPVLAGVVAARGADVVHAAGVRPWTGEAQTPLPGRDRVLVLASSTRAAQVEVTLRRADGRPLDPQRVEVAAEGTTTVRLPARAGAVALASDVAIVAALITEDGGRSVVPVVPAATRSGAPTVRPAG